MAHTSAHVAHTLAAYIDEVFGLMGNGNAYFLDALLRDTSATYTAVRHEAGAVVAADAHFRTSGRIAAATTTYGAGFTNTLTALAEAAQARVPLVLVVGDEPTSGPRPWDVDQIAMASAVGVRTYTVGDCLRPGEFLNAQQCNREADGDDADGDEHGNRRTVASFPSGLGPQRQRRPDSDCTIAGQTVAADDQHENDADDGKEQVADQRRLEHRYRSPL
ncbi:Thiamine pyrophosphate enzyme, N-terminal TPP binding domain [Brevibacterium iodinum ATCC 49514]|uniref:Thiamine pyrophosphate enzyme, N-terminal TPP binding domain n=1 Tax=Brevibacterium iodinum ATCC 49514 TaxID=1255616 RepID=A0A2H1KQE2_9MICO|nr:Thiamine pyrophosphate enzyme, N-terminal TPP binding domain [Brevibacterium iodinum ATCC 49514]SUW13246.1 Sulfoacetaldehyde acetyltransferase [Brevibacterium iodinum]